MLLLLLYFLLKVAGGWASKCMQFTCASLSISCSMLCAAQWQKSPGVFMRKKDKKFTIEDGILIEIFITFTIVLLVRDNWEEVCNMSKPLVHTSIPGKIMESALHYYNLW